MNKNAQMDLKLIIGLVTAASLIMTIVAAANNWPTWLIGLFGLIFLIAAVFWKFTR